MREAAQLLERAIALHQHGSPQEAEPLYREILASAPDHFDALHLLGVALHQQGNHEAAVMSIGHALAVNPADPSAHSNLALALRDLGRLDEALASLDRALSIRADHVQAHNNRGNVLRAMNRPARRLRATIARWRSNPITRRRSAAAGTFCSISIARRTRSRRSIDCSRCSPTMRLPGTFTASPWVTWAVTRTPSQVTTARSRSPRNSGKPSSIEAARYSISSATRQRRVRSAIWRAMRPTTRSFAGNGCTRKCSRAIGTGLSAIAAAVVDDVRAGRRSAEPFGFQAISTSPADLKRCAQIYAQARYPAAPAVWRGERYDHRRIRIGYVSGEFRQQATSMLMAELFERHDRARFELFAFDNGCGDDSPLRRRIERAFGGIGRHHGRPVTLKRPR